VHDIVALAITNVRMEKTFGFEQGDEPVTPILAAVISGLTSSAVVVAFFQFLVLRRKEEIVGAVRSEREWKERALAELLGPMVMQLNRTKRALNRLRPGDYWVEANVLLAGNTLIRDILLANGHLISPDLIVRADELIEHYDVWLQEYERVRGKDAKTVAEFVFAGPQGFGFPRQAEMAFRDRFHELLFELYRVKQRHPAAPETLS
jgi:hypothetical protein